MTNKPAIDREKMSPFLLRAFVSTSRHNNLADYNRGNVPSNELQIYTWMDATLKELTSLVREVNPDARHKGTYFDFAIVTPSMGRNASGPNGGFHHYVMKDIGTTASGKKSIDDSKTLEQCQFTIGDYIDISITPSNAPSRFDRYQDRDHRRNDRGGDMRRRGGGGGGGVERRPRQF